MPWITGQRIQNYLELAQNSTHPIEVAKNYGIDVAELRSTKSIRASKNRLSSTIKLYYNLVTTINITMDTLIQWNCNGFYTRLPELQMIISEYKPAYICLQETDDVVGAKFCSHYIS